MSVFLLLAVVAHTSSWKSNDVLRPQYPHAHVPIPKPVHTRAYSHKRNWCLPEKFARNSPGAISFLLLSKKRWWISGIWHVVVSGSTSRYTRALSICFIGIFLYLLVLSLFHLFHLNRLCVIRNSSVPARAYRNLCELFFPSAGSADWIC